MRLLEILPGREVGHGSGNLWGNSGKSFPHDRAVLALEFLSRRDARRHKELSVVVLASYDVCQIIVKVRGELECGSMIALNQTAHPAV